MISVFPDMKRCFYILLVMITFSENEMKRIIRLECKDFQPFEQFGEKALNVDLKYLDIFKQTK